MRMIRWITAGIAAGSLALAACVTINVYFPEAAAERAADRIIEDIWGREEAKKREGNEQSSVGMPGRAMLASAFAGAVELLVPAAHAQADIDISSPAIRALTASMKARAADLEPFFDSGAVGLTADGLIELRDANAVPLADRNRARKLVSDENADRNALYREIASANGHPEWEADIRSTFAARWVANARAGWYYKRAGGDWTKK
ncbi:MAG: YdbL family protein [Steroidobacteraceae bacterium]|nr:YdbL family protein [Steroidobacteraceae bacterium]